MEADQKPTINSSSLHLDEFDEFESSETVVREKIQSNKKFFEGDFIPKKKKSLRRHRNQANSIRNSNY